MTLGCETIHTWKGPLLPAPPLGTCNWRQLRGFARLVIQMSAGKRPLRANLGQIKERRAPARTGLMPKTKWAESPPRAPPPSPRPEAVVPGGLHTRALGSECTEVISGSHSQVSPAEGILEPHHWALGGL